MKQLLRISIVILFCTTIYSQKITEGKYNCIFNMAAYETMEAKPDQKGDQVDGLFDKIGLSSADARKGDIYTGLSFMNNPAQNFSIKMVEDRYYIIANQLTNNVLTVENESLKEFGNVIPAVYRQGNHQKFAIVRDTLKHRYGAFIIAKHSGMALTLNDKGSVVQKKLNPEDRTQVWCFSERIVWKNDIGFLGVKRLTIGKEEAVLTNDNKTTSWSFIAHPSWEAAFYVMNSNSKQFLMTQEAYDSKNPQKSYKLIQSQYVKGTNQLMNFYMVNADDSKTKVKIFEATSRYVVDVDAVTKNLILVPEEKASPLSIWTTQKAPVGL